MEQHEISMGHGRNYKNQSTNLAERSTPQRVEKVTSLSFLTTLEIGFFKKIQLMIEPKPMRKIIERNKKIPLV